MCVWCTEKSPTGEKPTLFGAHGEKPYNSFQTVEKSPTLHGRGQKWKGAKTDNRSQFRKFSLKLTSNNLKIYVYIEYIISNY